MNKRLQRRHDRLDKAFDEVQKHFDDDPMLVIVACYPHEEKPNVTMVSNIDDLPALQALLFASASDLVEEVL